MASSLPAFSTLVSDARYCHIRPIPRGRVSGLSVACAGVERCLPAYRVARAGFACFGLEFVAEGNGSVTLRGRRSPLQPGSAFLYGPNVRHDIVTSERRPMRKYFVDFFGAGAPTFLQRLELRFGEIRQVDDANVVQTLFDELIREGQRGSDRGAELADSYLRVLLQKVAELPAQPQPARPAAYRTWRRCQEIVETDFRRLRGLHELSQRTGLHPSHLCRIYKQFGLRSPHADITQRKLNHAAMLLMTSPTLVKSIAQQVGYDDPLHFSRVFRKHFGQSPLEFQRTQRRAG
jgi:AraC-like DNA-binding protein